MFTNYAVLVFATKHFFAISGAAVNTNTYCYGPRTHNLILDPAIIAYEISRLQQDTLTCKCGFALSPVIPPCQNTRPQTSQLIQSEPFFLPDRETGTALSRYSRNRLHDTDSYLGHQHRYPIAPNHASAGTCDYDSGDTNPESKLCSPQWSSIASMERQN